MRDTGGTRALAAGLSLTLAIALPPPLRAQQGPVAGGTGGGPDEELGGGFDATPAAERRESWLELGISASSVLSPLADADGNGSDAESQAGLDANGAFYYRRFFAEASGGVLGGFNVGFDLWADERVDVDLLALTFSVQSTVGHDLPAEPRATEVERDADLTDTGVVLLGSGLRVRGYAGDWIGQLRLTRAFALGGGGIDGSLRIGHQWPLERWLLHGIAGLEVNSARSNAAGWSVPTEHATTRFPAYRARAGVDLDVELGAALPIARDWVFRSSLSYRYLSESVRDSPLSARDYQLGVAASLFYVF